ncbi:hypothetical protein ACLOJK_003252 [Asimina triloba]
MASHPPRQQPRNPWKISDLQVRAVTPIRAPPVSQSRTGDPDPAAMEIGSHCLGSGNKTIDQPNSKRQRATGDSSGKSKLRSSSILAECSAIFK